MIHWLFSTILFSLHVFVFLKIFCVVDFKSLNIVVGKDAWSDFSFLKFNEAYFVAQHVINSEEHSVYT